MALEQVFDDDGVLTLATLGANTAILSTSKIDSGRLQGMRVVESELSYDVVGKTATEGPIVIGVCCNMTATEVANALVADPGDKNRDTNRGKGTYIKVLGMIGRSVTGIPGATPDALLAMMKISYGKNGWSVPEGKNLALFAYNMGAALTTGTVLNWFASHFGVWLRD